MESLASHTSVDSGLSQAVISVQIAYVDYYMSKLSEMSSDRQFIASLQRNSDLGSTKVPVLRVFGATAGGQKACVHLHGALPHFFVSLPETVNPSEAEKFAKQLHRDLERGVAASLRGGIPDSSDDSIVRKERYVYDVEPVLRYGIYGLQSEATNFLKISAFNPALLGRLAAMCASGLLACGGGELQPFESHIPFVLQAMVELNIVGMGFLNLSNCKFRSPLPQSSEDYANLFARKPREREFVRGLEEANPHLFWGFPVFRRTVSELELDAFVQDVLNKESLRQLDPDHGGNQGERAVHTLRVLWEEERLRKGEPVTVQPTPPRAVVPGPHLSNSSHLEVVQKLLRAEAAEEGKQERNTQERKPEQRHNLRKTQNVAGSQKRISTQVETAQNPEQAINLLRSTYGGQDPEENVEDWGTSESDTALLAWLGRNAERYVAEDPALGSPAIGEAEEVENEPVRDSDLNQAGDAIQGEDANVWEDIWQCSQQAADSEEEKEQKEETVHIPQLDGNDEESDDAKDRSLANKSTKDARSAAYRPLRTAADADATGSKPRRTRKSILPVNFELHDAIVDSTAKSKRRRTKTADYVPLALGEVKRPVTRTAQRTAPRALIRRSPRLDVLQTESATVKNFIEGPNSRPTVSDVDRNETVSRQRVDFTGSQNLPASTNLVDGITFPKRHEGKEDKAEGSGRGVAPSEAMKQAPVVCIGISDGAHAALAGIPPEKQTEKQILEKLAPSEILRKHDETGEDDQGAKIPNGNLETPRVPSGSEGSSFPTSNKESRVLLSDAGTRGPNTRTSSKKILSAKPRNSIEEDDVLDTPHLEFEIPPTPGKAAVETTPHGPIEEIRSSYSSTPRMRKQLTPRLRRHLDFMEEDLDVEGTAENPSRPEEPQLVNIDADEIDSVETDQEEVTAQETVRQSSSTIIHEEVEQFEDEDQGQKEIAAHEEQETLGNESKRLADGKNLNVPPSTSIELSIERAEGLASGTRGLQGDDVVHDSQETLPEDNEIEQVDMSPTQSVPCEEENGGEDHEQEDPAGLSTLKMVSIDMEKTQNDYDEAEARILSADTVRLELTGNDSRSMEELLKKETKSESKSPTKFGQILDFSGVLQASTQKMGATGSAELENEESLKASPSNGSTYLNLSTRSEQRVSIIRALKRPPKAADLANRAVELGLSSMVHPVPFYGRPEDMPRKPKTFGGVLFRIPHGGTMGLPEAEGITSAPKQVSKKTRPLASIVCPARRPPLAKDLPHYSFSKRRAMFSVRRTRIDSAGREVAFNESRPQQPNAGGATQSTDSQNSKAAPEKAPRRIYRRAENEGSDDSEHSSAEITDSASEAEDRASTLLEGSAIVVDGINIDRPASPKYDENNYFQIHSKRSRTASTVIDGIDVEKPPSPKYDERSFFPFQSKRSKTSATRSSHISGPERGSTNTSKEEPPPHRPLSDMAEPVGHSQKLTSIVVEVLASSRKSLLPDPRFDPLRAVVLIVRQDKVKARQAWTETQTLVYIAGEQRLDQLDPFRSGINGSIKLFRLSSEKDLIDEIVEVLTQLDPDILIGFDAQNESIGYLMDRCTALGFDFGEAISRMPELNSTFKPTNPNAAGTNTDEKTAPEPPKKVNVALEYMKKTAGGGFNIVGRHVINLWRVVRQEVKLNSYTFENVVAEVLGVRVAKHTHEQLNKWFGSGRSTSTHRSLRYVILRSHFTFGVVEALDVIGRTSEQARVYGIDFMSVLTRGSQYRVESMLIRLSHQRNFILLAATREQVFKQQAVECLPLVMEPRSRYYTDPVVVLDFQSLYPSMIIAHNLCFSTMMGSIRALEKWSDLRKKMGVVKDYKPPAATSLMKDGNEKDCKVFIGTNGEAFCSSELRRGILPQLLKEILDTRVMVKKAMKDVAKQDGNNIPQLRLLNARQFALKMIANVTYGYTSASFSGRMPCAGLADTIVQCSRDALEKSARLVETKWAHAKAKVVYGDTDSLFILLPGATRAAAHKLGEEMAQEISMEFPAPIKLQMEKVYHPCMLVTKKRYVGYAYESPEQITPVFDAKGVETVRRDTCDAVRKILERALRTLFETNNLSRVKRYLQRQWRRILAEKVTIGDFIFRQEVRLGSYKPGHLPPAAIVATRAMQSDPRAIPKSGERVSYVVIYSAPNAPLRDSVVAPEHVLMSKDVPQRINGTYYIRKQIVPTLERHFHLLGVDIAAWFAEMPRPAVRPQVDGLSRKGLRTLYGYYASEKCLLCDETVNGGSVCMKCLGNRQNAIFIVTQRLRAAEVAAFRYDIVCMECVRWRDPSDIGCTSLDCSVSLSKSTLRPRVELLRSHLSSVCESLEESHKETR